VEPRRGSDDLVDVRQLRTEHPRRLDRPSVTDEERRAHRHVVHPERLERDVERARGFPVPVGEQWHVDAERLRPRTVRPWRIARDTDRPDPCCGEIVAPVTQQLELIRSGGRPVVDVEAQESETRAEDVTESSRLLADRGPHPHVRNRATTLEHAATLSAGGRRAIVIQVQRDFGAECDRRARSCLPELIGRVEARRRCRRPASSLHPRDAGAAYVD